MDDEFKKTGILIDEDDEDPAVLPAEGEEIDPLLDEELDDDAEGLQLYEADLDENSSYSF